uniref:BPL/LPL catalytic domain-containing protein n=1 Tax=Polytomella parva TaxID=51329 RepID=A0A7S0UT30_9CHLO
MSVIASTSRPVLNVLRLNRFPILFQLNLEEALLRGTKDNWFIVNDGAFQPAIVMGISGKPEELINVKEAANAGIQVIKRFTGGGTVVVDSNTLFTSLIMQGSDVPHVPCFPQQIMKFTEYVYGGIFDEYGEFHLRENDYVFGERKFGGNAQAITGQRWLHHTSLLWDFDQKNMDLLKHPKKKPKYREERPHNDFVTRLCDHVPSRTRLLDELLDGVPYLVEQLVAQKMGGKEEEEESRAKELAAREGGVEQAIGDFEGRGFEIREASLAEAAMALQKRSSSGNKEVDLTAHLDAAELQAL